MHASPSCPPIAFHTLSFINIAKERRDNVVVKDASLSKKKKLFGRATRKVDIILEMTMGASKPFIQLLKNATRRNIVHYDMVLYFRKLGDI